MLALSSVLTKTGFPGKRGAGSYPAFHVTNSLKSTLNGSGAGQEVEEDMVEESNCREAGGIGDSNSCHKSQKW